MGRLVRRQHTDGNWIWFEDSPARCPAGHELGPNKVLIGWLPCGCEAGAARQRQTGQRAAGHRTWTCRTPLADGSECGLVLYDPPHTSPVSDDPERADA